MGRVGIDCREFPSDLGCSMFMSADSADELLPAAADHAVKVHGHQDGDELRAGLQELIRPA